MQLSPLPFRSRYLLQHFVFLLSKWRHCFEFMYMELTRIIKRNFVFVVGHWCSAKCFDRRINECLICCREGLSVCPLWYSAGVCAIDVTQILAPMLLQIYDANSARERNDMKWCTVRVEANGAQRTAQKVERIQICKISIGLWCNAV
jgi:hypothetical protein